MELARTKQNQACSWNKRAGSSCQVSHLSRPHPPIASGARSIYHSPHSRNVAIAIQIRRKKLTRRGYEQHCRELFALTFASNDENDMRSRHLPQTPKARQAIAFGWIDQMLGRITLACGRSRGQPRIINLLTDEELAGIYRKLHAPSNAEVTEYEERVRNGD